MDTKINKVRHRKNYMSDLINSYNTYKLSEK